MLEKYRPANGTEGQMFHSRFCDRCKEDEYYRKTGKGTGCNILGDTMCYDIDEPEYPEEWRYDENGDPVCTAFVGI